MPLIYLTLTLILIATINFNKELIDNVFSDAKEQKEWHWAQWVQWCIIYGSIMFLTQTYWQTIIFGCFYPTLYDLGLNVRRGLKWNHKGVHDFPIFIKIILIVIGLILIVVKG